ncbi:MAG: hypothetical protein LBM65_03405 [Oscillospiraceae bacterium]|jgi:chemotaxis protein histidine kinase CheA|nr:hypothetical protein [Oscillospiraceae bacterium]
MKQSINKNRFFAGKTPFHKPIVLILVACLLLAALSITMVASSIKANAVEVHADDDSMFEVILHESVALLEQLDELLIRYEGGYLSYENDINEVFYIVHSLKGYSYIFSCNVNQTVSQKMQDFIFMLRDEPAPEAYIDEIFGVIDEYSKFVMAQLEHVAIYGEHAKDNSKEILQKIAVLHDKVEESFYPI